MPRYGSHHWPDTLNRGIHNPIWPLSHTTKTSHCHTHCVKAGTQPDRRVLRPLVLRTPNVTGAHIFIGHVCAWCYVPAYIGVSCVVLPSPAKETRLVFQKAASRINATGRAARQRTRHRLQALAHYRDVAVACGCGVCKWLDRAAGWAQTGHRVNSLPFQAVESAVDR